MWFTFHPFFKLRARDASWFPFFLAFHLQSGIALCGSAWEIAPSASISAISSLLQFPVFSIMVLLIAIS
jgi:hypothetical protein